MGPRKFRKKPVVIEAWEFTADNHQRLAAWCGGRRGIERGDPPHALVISIPTLEGTMVARVGDFIIKGVQGEFYPCKDEIFRATYDLEGR